MEGKMQLADSVGRLCTLVLAAFLLFVSVASAADLILEPRTVSTVDVQRVVLTTDGSVGLLRAGRIEFVSPEGTVETPASAADGQTLYLGDRGNSIGIATHRVGAADFSPTASFELRDRSGAVRWAIGETEDVTYVISEHGDVVGMSLNINVPERNRMHFYGQDGSLGADVAVPHLIGGQFDPDGKVLLAISVKEGLLAFDAAGNRLWRVEQTRIYATAPGGERVACFGDQILRVAVKGEIIATTPLESFLVRRLAIAPDRSRVAAASKHEIRVYDGTSLELLQSIPTENESYSWTSVDVASDGGWLVAGAARSLGLEVPVNQRHPDGEVRVYDASGNLVHQAHMEFPIWNIWTPTAILDRSGTEATITTRRAVYRTVLP
jgi:hypothetical protein